MSLLALKERSAMNLNNQADIPFVCPISSDKEIAIVPICRKFTL